jgi:hypothetical protein
MEKYSTRLDATNFPKKKLIMELQNHGKSQSTIQTKRKLWFNRRIEKKRMKIITNR